MADLSRFHRAAARHAGRTVSFRSPLDEITAVEVLQVRSPTVSQLDAELPGYTHHLDVRAVDLPDVEEGWRLTLDGTDYEVIDAEPIGPDDAITRCYLEARGEEIA